MNKFKEYYYYFRNAENKPLVTVCLLINPNTEQWSRGVAICSKQDNPCKKTGRKIARQRAFHAMETKENDLYMSEKFWCDFWLNNGKWINPTMKYLECKAASCKPKPINEIEAKILKDNNIW